MNDEGLTLDASRCALIIQDLQNDVITDGGAFAETGSPDHAREQNVVADVAALALHAVVSRCRLAADQPRGADPASTIRSSS